MKQHLPRTSVIAGLAVLGLAAALSAQSGQSGQPAGFADLLAEVKALRADVNQAASASLRAQLLVARLSLQEQRITALGRQLIDVQAQLVAAMRERTEIESQVKRFNEAAADGSLPADERKAVESHIRDLKASQLPQRQLAEQQLRTQESELAGVIASEQNRWTEFNARLDELERSLPGATPR
jgi:hypothetical protein